jgi:hypothetical protein
MGRAGRSLGSNLRLLAVLAAAPVLGAVLVGGSWRPLNTHTGYAPQQPIAYSHRLHAGELGMDCLYCHFGARTSRHAGIPPAGLCMNCHEVVGTAFDRVLEEKELATAEGREPRRLVSDEVAKLYAAVGLDREQRPLPGGPQPLAWARVHNLPDFVAFDHSVHVARGVACQSCHGPVEAMERVSQFADLSMGWCLDCHRSQPAGVDHLLTGTARLPHGEHVSTDCAACHH